jgi:prenyltransferase beta subunit
MRRIVFASFVAACFVQALHAQQPTAEQKQATLKYLYSLQKDNGGYAADTKPDSQATLGATSSALRAIKYFGGEPRHKDASAKYILSCFHKEDNGFAPKPDGKADVRSTALGLMALVACELDVKDYIAPCTTFLCSHAESFEDRRLAAAAFETAKTKCGLADSWLATIQKTRNPDGTFGKGPTLARDTGGVAVTILRLDGVIDNREKVIQTLKSGQLTDGGWGKEEAKSDLESTYRVMRCFMMMKAKPDIEACEKCIAHCRNADGSYSVQPGQPGNVSATYFAGICLHWLEEMKR